MNTQLRAALAAVTGATMLLVASCSSSAPDSAPSSAVSVTASAWVKPVGSGSMPTSGTSVEASASSDSAIQSSPSVVTDRASDPYFSAAPLPAGLSEADHQQAEAAIDTYARYWSLTNRLGSNPDVDSAVQIAEVATGTAATELEKSFERFREKGLRITGQNAVVVTVQRVEAGAVDLLLCVDGSEGRVVDSTGTPVDDNVDRETRRAGSARVGHYTSGWKVDTNVFDMASSC